MESIQNMKDEHIQQQKMKSGISTTISNPSVQATVDVEEQNRDADQIEEEDFKEAQSLENERQRVIQFLDEITNKLREKKTELSEMKKPGNSVSYQNVDKKKEEVLAI